MFLVVCFGMCFVMLSMAEMASIAPTSGGQYRRDRHNTFPQHYDGRLTESCRLGQ